MSEERVPDDVVERLRKMFVRTVQNPTPLDLTPHRVAEGLRQLGWPVGDALVLKVYETLRKPADESSEVKEAKEFLASHAEYVEWKRAVARGETLGGFFEWKAQQS